MSESGRWRSLNLISHHNVVTLIHTHTHTLHFRNLVVAFVEVNYELYLGRIIFGKGCFFPLSLKQVHDITSFMCFPIAFFSAKEWDDCCTGIIPSAGLNQLLYYVINVIRCHVGHGNKGLNYSFNTDVCEDMIHHDLFL